MVAAAAVVIEEGADLPLELSRQEEVFRRDALIQGLVPAFDLAVSLGMVVETQWRQSSLRWWEWAGAPG